MKKNQAKLLLPLLAIVVILGCATKREAKTEKPIKVMAYNIHIASPPSIKPDFSFTDLDAVADVINREKPDLVSLQEVDKYTARSGKQSHQANDLGAKTGMYAHFADAVDRSEGVQGVAILSKYPIKKADQYKLPVPQGSKGETRSIALVIVEIAGKDVLFCSTHIDHMSDETRQFQVNQILTILAKYKGYPIIFSGDLNMQPNSPVFKSFDGVLNPSTNQLLTFPSVKPKLILDYILFNNQFNDAFTFKRYYTVDEKYASDHLPLVAEFVAK